MGYCGNTTPRSGEYGEHSRTVITKPKLNGQNCFGPYPDDYGGTNHSPPRLLVAVAAKNFVLIRALRSRTIDRLRAADLNSPYVGSGTHEMIIHVRQE